MKNFGYKGFDQKYRKWKKNRLRFVQYLELGRVRDTEFGDNVSNKKLLYTVNCQVSPLLPSATQIRIKKLPGTVT